MLGQTCFRASVVDLKKRPRPGKFGPTNNQ